MPPFLLPFGLPHEEQFVWPKQAKLYLHGEKDSRWDEQKELGLSDEAMKQYAYVGYEVCLDIEVNEDGTALAFALNGVPLTEKVKV